MISYVVHIVEGSHNRSNPMSFKDLEKALFEGDIVRYPWWTRTMEKQDIHMVVTFKEGEFVLEPPHGVEGVWPIRICGESEHMEHIGNIYDNPELMN